MIEIRRSLDYFFSGDVRGIPHIKTFCQIYFCSKDPPPVFAWFFTYFTRIIKFFFSFWATPCSSAVSAVTAAFFFQCENTGNFAVTNKKEIFRDRKSHVSFVFCSGGNTLPAFVEVDPQNSFRLNSEFIKKFFPQRTNYYSRREGSVLR